MNGGQRLVKWSGETLRLIAAIVIGRQRKGKVESFAMSLNGTLAGVIIVNHERNEDI